jgi:hypothetical protein
MAALTDAAYTGFLSTFGLQTSHYSVLDVKTELLGATFENPPRIDNLSNMYIYWDRLLQLIMKPTSDEFTNEIIWYVKAKQSHHHAGFEPSDILLELVYGIQLRRRIQHCGHDVWGPRGLIATSQREGWRCGGIYRVKRVRLMKEVSRLSGLHFDPQRRKGLSDLASFCLFLILEKQIFFLHAC